MVLSRKTAALLIAAGLWPLLVWPNFVRVVVTDERAFDGDGPTAYLVVHVALAAVSMSLGVALVALGVRAWRSAGRHAAGPPSKTAPRETARSGAPHSLGGGTLTRRGSA